MGVHEWIKYCFMFILFVEVSSQVCTKQINKSSRQTSFYTNSGEDCGTEGCKTGTSEHVLSYEVTKSVIVEECCPGFIKKDEALNASRENCVLSCESECKHGRCTLQNDCECFTHYEKHPTRNSCIYKCEAGYTRIGNTCQPICSKPCGAGHCVAPELCRCYEGMLISGGPCISNSTCTPPCGNGTCKPRGRCYCNRGYKLNNNKNLQCIPLCRLCGAPACFAPNKCQCPQNYTSKFMTVDGRDCECDTPEDCDIKCEHFVCKRNNKLINGTKNATDGLYAANTPICASSNSTFLYISICVNIILFFIVLVILNMYLIKRWKKSNHSNIINTVECHAGHTDITGGQRTNCHNPPLYESIHENNMAEGCNHYTEMNGANRNNRDEPPQYESIHGPSGAGEPLCYDYVQTPLPIHMRKV